MAASKSILSALSDLDDFILETRTLTDTLIDLAGDQAGAAQWPFLLQCQIDRIHKASVALETLVRQKALPLLADIEAANAIR